jgi:hypothetical protein
MLPAGPAKEELLTYTTAAVPHEAGHILFGRMAGLPVRALDHFVIRGPNDEMLPGDFATVGVAPMSSAAVAMTPKPVVLAFAFFCAGGLPTRERAEDHFAIPGRTHPRDALPVFHRRGRNLARLPKRRRRSFLTMRSFQAAWCR